MARRILRDDESARDAVQDAFLAAWRSIEAFDGRSRVSTWLYRIVVNTCLLRLRWERRRLEDMTETLPDVAAEGIVDTLDGLERTQYLLAVCDGIRRLPAHYQTVIRLRCIEDLGTHEAARAVGITANAVKIRLHRARRMLRELLRADPNGGSTT